MINFTLERIIMMMMMKIIIDFLGAQIFLVEKIYFGIHFQFLSLQSKTNVLSVGNKNYKRQHTSY